MISSTDVKGTILVAPHQFPGLEKEELLAKEFGLTLVAAPDSEAFRTSIADAAIVMVTPYARVEEHDFQAMKNCLAVVRYGMGYDNIDVDAAHRAGVPVAIVPGTASEEVASHALTMGLALSRRIPAGRASIDDGGWAGSIGYDAPKLTDLEIGIVGMGRIGRQVASWYRALGAQVKAYDPFLTFEEVRAAPLDEVLEQSDIVSLHIPLTAETKHFISADVIARMRPRSIIVNVSRGGLIDEEALADALRSGHLAGAGLDTFSKEPLPSSHPLREVPNVLLTPHTAWRSNKALEALQDGAVLRARQALTGEAVLDLV